MITPRHFEEKLAEITTEYREDPDTMRKLIFKLMADALETWGYRTDTVRQLEHLFHG